MLISCGVYRLFGERRMNAIRRMIRKLRRQKPKGVHETYFLSCVPDSPRMQKTLDKALGVYYPSHEDVVINVQKCLDVAFEINEDSLTQIAETIGHEDIHHILKREVDMPTSRMFDNGHVSFYNMYAVYEGSIRKDIAYILQKDELRSCENAILIQLCEEKSREILKR